MAMVDPCNLAKNSPPKDGLWSKSETFVEVNHGTVSADAAGDRGSLWSTWIHQISQHTGTTSWTGTWDAAVSHPNNAAIAAQGEQLRPYAACLDITFKTMATEKVPTYVVGILGPQVGTSDLDSFSNSSSKHQVTGGKMASYPGTPGDDVRLWWRPHTSDDYRALDNGATAGLGSNYQNTDTGLTHPRFFVGLSGSTASVPAFSWKLSVAYEYIPVSSVAKFSPGLMRFADPQHHANTQAVSKVLKTSLSNVPPGQVQRMAMRLGSLLGHPGIGTAVGGIAELIKKIVADPQMAKFFEDVE